MHSALLHSSFLGMDFSGYSRGSCHAILQSPIQLVVVQLVLGWNRSCAWRTRWEPRIDILPEAGGDGVTGGGRSRCALHSHASKVRNISRDISFIFRAFENLRNLQEKRQRMLLQYLQLDWTLAPNSCSSSTRRYSELCATLPLAQGSQSTHGLERCWQC